MAVTAQCGGILTGKGLVTSNGVLEVAVGDTIAFTGDELEIVPMANIADSEEAASPTTAEFNALLAALKTAGFMVADEA